LGWFKTVRVKNNHEKKKAMSLEWQHVIFTEEQRS
jgi:hypothetical protein